jgi:hypothetical protein
MITHTWVTKPMTIKSHPVPFTRYRRKIVPRQVHASDAGSMPPCPIWVDQLLLVVGPIDHSGRVPFCGSGRARVSASSDSDHVCVFRGHNSRRVVADYSIRLSGDRFGLEPAPGSLTHMRVLVEASLGTHLGVLCYQPSVANPGVSQRNSPSHARSWASLRSDLPVRLSRRFPSTC